LLGKNFYGYILFEKSIEFFMKLLYNIHN
jgi:hypothetical protein